MKRIGIVGGVGWQSTVEYYAGLCRLSEQRRRKMELRNGPVMPEICIESLDLNTAAALLGRDDHEDSWRRFDEYHRTALMRLQASDADVAVLASNTAHHRFASITLGVAIPVLSILDATAREAVRVGATRALILGTELTMRSRMYPETFLRIGIQAASPPKAKTRATVIEIIEDLHAERIDGAGDRIAAVARDSFGGQIPDDAAVCLACTELPLAFPFAKEHASFGHAGIRYISSTAAHIAALFEFASAS